ncbi:hypothetical protein [Methylobacterium soli]|uniref:Uncharacterized protein n=1 Tax=Methylobacterium soli TaxID=553447 RepID=A0A6L3SUP2_9HYPH|nr:hypothetical protein [Methylobacterium soli]KAB1073845.1 hypothetical protein F6X53_26625 [Methylobacterium soli]GJE46836.1 hypothetical protein AEGHOMDF_6045 [Methylobacterium soli]
MNNLSPHCEAAAAVVWDKDKQRINLSFSHPLSSLDLIHFLMDLRRDALRLLNGAAERLCPEFWSLVEEDLLDEEFKAPEPSVEIVV